MYLWYTQRYPQSGCMALYPIVTLLKPLRHDIYQKIYLILHALLENLTHPILHRIYDAYPIDSATRPDVPGTNPLYVGLYLIFCW